MYGAKDESATPKLIEKAMYEYLTLVVMFSDNQAGNIEY